MPLYIFSFNDGDWGKSWIVALAITLLALGSLELFWRSREHKPAIVDDQRLWSLQRSKIGKTAKEIALLGSSRMQLDISLITLHELAPEHNIINLSIDNSCANAVLKDLADDTNFKGKVLCDITEECLLFGDYENGQKAFIAYYKNVFNINAKLNRIISNCLQENIVLIDPYLNLSKIIINIVLKGELRPPNYLITHEDRTRSADYSKIDIVKHRAKRIDIIKNNYQSFLPKISKEAFIQKAFELENAVEKIQNRGGRVVFIRFPVSNEHWDIDKEYFPREKYWDLFASITKAEVVHFKDVEGFARLQCPDTSHLDFRDTPEFTTLLFSELVKRNVF